MRQLKLSKTSWIFLAAGIFLIVGISLFMTRSQQTDRQNSLQEDLRKSNLNLSLIKLDELSEQKGTLTRQIAEYESQTAETKAILTSSKDSIDTTNAILEEALTQGVDIKDLSSPGVTTEMLEGNSCETLSINIMVRGNILNVAGFISALNKTFPTSVIKSMQLNIQQPSPTPTGVTVQAEKTPAGIPAADSAPGRELPEEAPAKDTTVNINLVIYNYKGK
jgi:hypothetical protein